MMCLIKHMLEEIDGAESYCTAAHDEASGSEARRVYKELALQELSHFDRLASMYSQKVSSTRSAKSDEDMSDVWFKYFKDKAEKLRTKLQDL